MDNCADSARQMAIVANAIAVALTKNLTASEQNVLGNLFAQVGATILSIAAATQYCSEAESSRGSSVAASDSSS